MEYSERDEIEEAKYPEVGKAYPIVIAVGEDAKTLVVEAPEEFWTIANEQGGYECGGYYFGRLDDDPDPGVYRATATFRFERGEGEFGGYDPGGNDWWFDLSALAPASRFELTGQG